MIVTGKKTYVQDKQEHVIGVELGVTAVKTVAEFQKIHLPGGLSFIEKGPEGYVGLYERVVFPDPGLKQSRGGPAGDRLQIPFPEKQFEIAEIFLQKKRCRRGMKFRKFVFGGEKMLCRKQKKILAVITEKTAHGFIRVNQFEGIIQKEHRKRIIGEKASFHSMSPMSFSRFFKMSLMQSHRENIRSPRKNMIRIPKMYMVEG